jgi:hypothetical protein
MRRTPAGPVDEDAEGLAEHLGFVGGVLDGVDAECRVGGTMAKASARKCALLMEGTVRQAKLLGALASLRHARGWRVDADNRCSALRHSAWNGPPQAWSAHNLAKAGLDAAAA